MERENDDIAGSVAYLLDGIKRTNLKEMDWL